MLTHLLGIFVGLPTAIIFYVLYRERGPFVRSHTATELNFQITLACVSFFAVLISFGSMFTSIAVSSGSGMPPGMGLFFVGYFLMIALRLAAVVLGILASVAAHRGQFYQYPAIKFVK